LVGSAFASGRRHHAEPDDNRLLLFPSGKPGYCYRQPKHRLVPSTTAHHSQQRVCSVGLLPRQKKKKGERGEEREREKCVNCANSAK